MTPHVRRIELSVVVPCYNEEEALPVFLRELVRVVSRLVGMSEFEAQGGCIELVIVDDGSCDDTEAIVREISKRDDLPFEVRWIAFSRNFGKEAALLAGLRAARGSYVVTMDADMQDPPELLPEMYRFLRENPDYDSVATRREDREGEPRVRSAFARVFYRIINRISDAEIVDGARDFRLMTRLMVNAVLSMEERNRFTKGIYGWVGFKTKWVPYKNVERVSGKTKWSFFGLLSYALDGIEAFSATPLAVASVMGMSCCVLALVCAVFVVVRALVFGDPVAGWPSLMAVILAIGGIQLLCVGIIGRYLSKVYTEVKRRPHYIVRSSNIIDGER